MKRIHRTETIEGTRIKVYDNGGRSFDRYTVLYVDEPWSPRLVTCLAMSHNPFHPQGFGQHSGAVPGRHLGRRIKFDDLPLDCQRAVMQDLTVVVG